MLIYYTFHNGNIASSPYSTEELAEACAAEQNEKALTLGIEPSYYVESREAASENSQMRPLNELASVWRK